MSRYVTISDYIDKILIVSFASATIGESVGIVSTSFTLTISLTSGIIKILLNMTIKKKKHYQLLLLAESKFNSIETLISQTLGDLDISHEKFIMILKEKDKYKKMKCNLISENEDEKQEIAKLSSI